MRTGINKSLIFVLTSTLVIMVLYGSSTTLNVFAVPPADGWGPSNTCGAETTNPETGDIRQTCCWKERTGTSLGPGKEVMYCQTCDSTAAGLDCKPRVVQQALQPPLGTVPPEDGVFEQPPTPPPSGPAAPPKGGILEQLEEQPTQPLPSPPTAGESVFPGDTGVLQQPPSEGGVTQRGCQSNVVTTCLPCDLGLPGASCIPASEWPPDTAQLEQGEGAAPPFVPGFLERQQQPPPADQGAAELPPPTEETTPTQPSALEEELAPCPEGQILDEESGLCVLEEPETQETEEQQGSEENGSEDNTNN